MTRLLPSPPRSQQHGDRRWWQPVLSACPATTTACMDASTALSTITTFSAHHAHPPDDDDDTHAGTAAARQCQQRVRLWAPPPSHADYHSAHAHTLTSARIPPLHDAQYSHQQKCRPDICWYIGINLDIWVWNLSISIHTLPQLVGEINQELT